MTDPHSAPASPADDEPESPFWLPALGFVLFIVGGLAWAVTPPMAHPTAEPAAKAAEPASATGSPMQPAAPPAAAPIGTFPAPTVAPLQPAVPAHSARDASPHPAKPAPGKPTKKQQHP
jgi:hypothetical protein